MAGQLRPLTDWLGDMRGRLLDASPPDLTEQLRRLGEIYRRLAPQAASGVDVTGSLPRSFPLPDPGAAPAGASRPWWQGVFTREDGTIRRPFGSLGGVGPEPAQAALQGAPGALARAAEPWIARAGFSVFGALLLAGGIAALVIASGRRK